MKENEERKDKDQIMRIQESPSMYTLIPSLVYLLIFIKIASTI